MKRRELTEAESKAIEEAAPVVAQFLIRLGRNYVASVRAPSREENRHAEERFENALTDFIKFLAESGAF